MNIFQIWLQKDSKVWSKKDADYLVNGMVGIRTKIVTMDWYGSGDVFFVKTRGKPTDKLESSFSMIRAFQTYKLGGTFFSKEAEEFFCRESLTNRLRRVLVEDGKIKNASRMSLVRDTFELPLISNINREKYAFLEESWKEYAGAFLGMCGVSKNIRTDFVKYNPNNGKAVFPASLALWRSTYFTAPSVLVGLMRYPGIFVDEESETLYTLPKTLELILEDKKKSWNSNGKRQMLYYVFGTGSMLWMSLLWINKLREVCDNNTYSAQDQYIDGSNSFTGALSDSIVKVLRGLSKSEKKELYTLMGGRKDNSADFTRVAHGFSKDIKEILGSFPKEVA